MIPRRAWHVLAAVAPAAILATGLYFAVQPAMSNTPVTDPDPDSRSDNRTIWPALGQSVTMTFESDGCTHYEVYRVALSGSAPDRMHVLAAADDKGARTVELDDATRTAIERYVAYLRAQPKPGCYAEDTLAITWKYPDGTEVVENLRDVSCGLTEPSDLRSLGEIIAATAH